MAPKMPDAINKAINGISAEASSPKALRTNVNTALAYLCKLSRENKKNKGKLSGAESAFKEFTGLTVDDIENWDLKAAITKGNSDGLDDVAQIKDAKKVLNEFTGLASDDLIKIVGNKLDTASEKLNIELPEDREDDNSDSKSGNKRSGDSGTTKTKNAKLSVSGNNPTDDSNESPIKSKFGEFKDILLIESIDNIGSWLGSIFTRYKDLLGLLVYPSDLELLSVIPAFTSMDLHDTVSDAVVDDETLARVYVAKEVWNPFEQHVKSFGQATQKTIAKFNKEHLAKLKKEFNSSKKSLDIFAKAADRFRIGIDGGSRLHIYAKNSAKVFDVVTFLGEQSSFLVKFTDNHYVGTKKDKKKCFIDNGELSVDVEKYGKYCYIPKKKSLKILSDETVVAKNVGKDYVIEKIGYKLFNDTVKGGVFADLGGRPAKDRFLADF